MDTLSFPITFIDGSVTKIAEGSDEYYSHLLALLVQIQPEDLPLNPQYGILDPTFSEILTRDMAMSVGAFIPEIIVDSAEIIVDDSGETRVNIAFSQRT